VRITTLFASSFKLLNCRSDPPNWQGGIYRTVGLLIFLKTSRGKLFVFKTPRRPVPQRQGPSGWQLYHHSTPKEEGKGKAILNSL